MAAPEHVEIGHALMRRREKLGLAVQYISARLILSTQQVRDLEDLVQLVRDEDDRRPAGRETPDDCEELLGLRGGEDRGRGGLRGVRLPGLRARGLHPHGRGRRAALRA